MVRGGLTTFVEKKFRGWKKVSVKGPLIVDGYSLCHELYLHSGADNVHGGDYVSFSKYVVRFLNCLLQNQIQPFVVFDGIDADQSKKETHDKRRIENAQRVQGLLMGKPASSRGDYYLPYLARLVMVEAVTSVLGEPNLYVADGDADSVIAAEAISQNCPVLSIDSDFYIFPIAGGYISYTDMTWNETSVEARIFYYRDFAKQFNIRDPKLLIMLPAILGDSVLQPLNDALGVISKSTRSIKSSIKSEVVLIYASQFSLLEDCKRDLTRISKRQNPLNNVEAAYKTYYSAVERPEPTTLKVKGSYQTIPKLILDHFRTGKFPTLLMDVMCCGEVDHRIAVEDMRGPWCHKIGVPIREKIYGIICGNHCSIAEHHRRSGQIDNFHVVKVSTVMPANFHCAGAPILDPQYHDMASQVGKEIMMAISDCTRDLTRLDIPDKFWFFYVVTRFWYLHIDSQVDKDVLLKAVILSSMKYLKAPRTDFLAVQVLPNPPNPAAVHALAQWQSVYYDIYCLNQLLLEPLPPLQISTIFECSNVIKVFFALLDSNEGDLICQMQLGDADKNTYRSLYTEVKKT